MLPYKSLFSKSLWLGNEQRLSAGFVSLFPPIPSLTRLKLCRRKNGEFAASSTSQGFHCALVHPNIRSGGTRTLPTPPKLSNSQNSRKLLFTKFAERVIKKKRFFQHFPSTSQISRAHFHLERKTRGHQNPWTLKDFLTSKIAGFGILFQDRNAGSGIFPPLDAEPKG